MTAKILSDMESKARIAANYFGTNASGDTSSEDYLTTAQNYVSSFEDGTRLELQFLDPSGEGDLPSNGLTLSGTMPGTGDIDRVREKQEIASWQGELPPDRRADHGGLRPPAGTTGAGGDHALRHLHAPGGPAGDHPHPGGGDPVGEHSDPGVHLQHLLRPLHRGPGEEHHRHRPADRRGKLRHPGGKRSSTTRWGTSPTPSTTCPCGSSRRRA